MRHGARRALLLTLLVAAPLAAAPLPKLGLEVHAVGVAKFPLVDLTFTITDPEGRAVVDFAKSNFQVFENLRPARVEDASLDPTPISVVLLLDRSGSMYPALEHLRMAAGKFVQVLEPRDQTMLIDFSDEPKILSGFTADRGKLQASLRTLKAWGPTAFYDSLYRAVLEVAEREGRRVVVAFTDGTDQNEKRTAPLSRHTLRDVLELARKHEVPVSTVGLGQFVEKRELQTIATATGGGCYLAPTSVQLEQLYGLIARNLKSRVRLVYRSPEQRLDGTWREASLKCVVAGAPVGSTEAKFRAPGRYVLDLTGQGWDAQKAQELAAERPIVTVRDRALTQVVTGTPEDLTRWLHGYFAREGAPRAAAPSAASTTAAASEK